MSYLWWAAFGCAHHCYNVKSEPSVDMFGLDIIVDGLTEVLQFPVVYGFLRFCKHTVTTGFHLHKDHHTVVEGDDIEISVSYLPVTFYDVVTFMLKKG